MLALMIVAVSLGLVATALYEQGGLSGLAWQLIVGTSVFVTYSLLATPFYERLFAATHTQGTISFLIFASDCFGYIIAISLLLYQDFSCSTTANGTTSANGAAANRDELRIFLQVLWGCGGAVLVTLLLAFAYFFVRISATVIAEPSTHMS